MNITMTPNAAARGNGWLQIVVLSLMVLVFGTTIGLIYKVLNTETLPAQAGGSAAPAGAVPSPPAAVSTEAPNIAPQPGSLPNPPPPGSFGVFDTNQSGGLPLYAKFLIATIILITGSVLEMFLIILYAAFFVNDPANNGLPMGLPPATVRVFLVGIIVLVILVFAMLPNLWGDNKAVVLLFGLLSTVVGFYFGSRAVADALSTDSAPTPVRLQLEDASKTQSKAALQPLSGTLDANFQEALGLTSPSIYAALLDSSGGPQGKESIAVADRTGKVIFDFDAALQTAPEGSYIMRVMSPPSVVCDERISLTP